MGQLVPGQVVSKSHGADRVPLKFSSFRWCFLWAGAARAATDGGSPFFFRLNKIKGVTQIASEYHSLHHTCLM